MRRGRDRERRECEDRERRECEEREGLGEERV